MNYASKPNGPGKDVWVIRMVGQFDVLYSAGDLPRQLSLFSRDER
jgi:hypothetical protein